MLDSEMVSPFAQFHIPKYGWLDGPTFFFICITVCNITLILIIIIFFLFGYFYDLK